MRNKYGFTKDDKCITLYKLERVKDEKAKNFGEEKQNVIGYYSSVDQVMRKLVFLELIEKGSIQDLLEDLRLVVPSVQTLIKGE